MAILATFTIPNAAAPSNGVRVNFKDLKKISLGIPAAWTAADIKMQFSYDNVTFEDILTSAGAVIKLTSVPTTGGGQMFAPENAAGIDLFAEFININPNVYVRLVSINTAGGANLVQGAQRVIRFISNNKRRYF